MAEKQKEEEGQTPANPPPGSMHSTGIRPDDVMNITDNCFAVIRRDAGVRGRERTHERALQAAGQVQWQKPRGFTADAGG
eukprot:3629458-Rhodomonas_salina.3